MFHDPRQLFFDIGGPVQSQSDRRRLLGCRTNMIMRCYDPEHPAAHNYSGRGITVCDEWLNDREAFVQFALANGWKPGLQIDRRNNDGNYQPSNVRFVTNRVNLLNKRSTVRLADGSPAWPAAEGNGVTLWAFCSRVARGWTPEQAAGLDPPPAPLPWAAARLIHRIADENGIKPEVALRRVRKGWTYMQACGLDPAPLSTRHKSAPLRRVNKAANAPRSARMAGPKPSDNGELQL